jgi:hypothetical protein
MLVWRTQFYNSTFWRLMFSHSWFRRVGNEFWTTRVRTSISKKCCHRTTNITCKLLLATPVCMPRLNRHIYYIAVSIILKYSINSWETFFLGDINITVIPQTVGRPSFCEVLIHIAVIPQTVETFFSEVLISSLTPQAWMTALCYPALRLPHPSLWS